MALGSWKAREASFTRCWKYCCRCTSMVLCWQTLPTAFSIDLAHIWLLHYCTHVLKHPKLISQHPPTSWGFVRIRAFQETKLNAFSWWASLVTSCKLEVTDCHLGPESEVPKASKKPLIGFNVWGFFYIFFLIPFSGPVEKGITHNLSQGFSSIQGLMLETFV